MNHDSAGFLAALNANGTVRFVYPKPVDNIAFGNFLQIQKDGTTVVSNADGRVLRVVKSNGETFEFTYSETTKQLSGINFPDGSRWLVHLDGRWHAHDKNAPSSRQLRLTPSVDQDGNLWLRNKTGASRQYISRSNGR